MNSAAKVINTLQLATATTPYLWLNHCLQALCVPNLEAYCFTQGPCHIVEGKAFQSGERLGR